MGKTNPLACREACSKIKVEPPGVEPGIRTCEFLALAVWLRGLKNKKDPRRERATSVAPYGGLVFGGGLASLSDVSWAMLPFMEGS